MLTIKKNHPEAVIGFLETNYSAIESSERATLMLGLISGGVQNNVNVRLGFSEGTAQGKKILATIHVSITNICVYRWR